VLSLIVFAIYQLNGDFAAYDDSWPNLNLARLIWRDGDLTFQPQDVPQLFEWKVRLGDRSAAVRVDWYDENVAAAMQQGWLQVTGPDDLPLRTPVPNRYANCFGLGAAISALPVVAAASLKVGSLDERPDLLWWIGKWVASAWAAGSVGLVFLTVRRVASNSTAWLVALAYGLATCLFSVSSQSLWQHAPNQFMLALGTYAFFSAADRWTWAAVAGAAYGAAVWCRPTSALIVIPVGVYLLLVSRKQFLAFALAGLPLALLFVAYNLAVFGTWFAVGQNQGQAAALERTGSPDMFQTPLWRGAAGTLTSPSRGLFVYSPFLLFALPGVWRCWRRPEFARWRPLSVGILGVWCVQFQFFDWWGGWSFAYRHLVDTTTLFVLFLVPALPIVLANRWTKGTFVGLLTLSLAIQALGTWCFDLSGWNAREGFWLRSATGTAELVIEDPLGGDDWPPRQGTDIEVVDMDVDFPPYRHRLWSWSDSQLIFYTLHPAQTRANRQALVARALRSITERKADTQAQLGDAWCELGDFERAAAAFARALQLEPDHLAATLSNARAAAALGHTEAAVAHHRRLLARSPDVLPLLVNWALLQAALEAPDEALAALVRARSIHPVYARDLYRKCSKLWREQVAERLQESQRRELARLDERCTADWFYQLGRDGAAEATKPSPPIAP
jgi:tetratricopeptide (TPR) repeat protein